MRKGDTDYYTIETETSYGSWLTFQDGPHVCYDDQESAIEFAKKLVSIGMKARVEHTTRNIVWQSV